MIRALFVSVTTRRSIPFLLAGGILLSLVLVASRGCGEGVIGRPAPSATEVGTSVGVHGQSDFYGGTLTIRQQEDMSRINPLSAGPEMQNIVHAVFSGLMRLDAQLQPVPDLAESWTSSPDDLTWTFKLRPGVRWHDGTTLTSDDVLFTYKTLLNEPIGGGNAESAAPVAVAQTDMQQAIEEIKAIDPYTVQVRLRHRFAPLLVDLTVPILPRHLLSDQPISALWNESITVGTGPFLVSKSHSADVVELDAFPQYFLGRPYLDRVTFRLAQDEGAAAQDLKNRQLMLAKVDSTTASQLSNVEGIKVITYPDLTFYFVGFNLRQGRLFADKAVRQAWGYALDKEQLVREATGGSGEPIWSDIPTFSWASDSGQPRPAQDLDKARELLNAAGWQLSAADGIRTKGNQRLSGVLMVRQDAPERIRAAELMATQLRKVGIELRVAPADFGSAMAAARRPPFDFDALLMGWTMGDDPDDYYLFHSSQIPSEDNPAGYNFVGFRNEGFDRLVAEARGTTDWRRRAELYHESQRMLADEPPYYFLWAERAYVAASSRLMGTPELLSPSFWWNSTRWWIAPR